MVESEEEVVLQVQLRNEIILFILVTVFLLLVGCNDSISKLSVASNIAPDPISGLTTLKVNDNYIQVIWDIPISDYLDHYMVYICENSDVLTLTDNLYTDKLLGFAGKNRQGITIRNLQASTEYKLGVISVNKYGANNGLQDSIVVTTTDLHINDTEVPQTPELVNISAHLTKGIDSAANTEIEIEFTPGNGEELITPDIRFSPMPAFANWDSAFPITNSELFVPEVLNGETGVIRFNFQDAAWPIPFQMNDFEFMILLKSKDAENNVSENSINTMGIFKVEVQSGCIKCWNCINICPENAISKSSSKAVIDITKCTRCGDCVLKCADKGSEVIFFKTEETGGSKW